MSLTFNPNNPNYSSDPAEAAIRKFNENKQQQAESTQPEDTSKEEALVVEPEKALRDLKVVGSNPLHKFQTYNSLFTLAVLTKEQQRTGKFSAPEIKNIICSSKGDWEYPEKRASTSFGSYDYWIDDLTIITQPSFSPATGNMFAHKITFRVTEPYSMGLFMLTCKEAARQAGYRQNFQTAPYLLMIEFAGYVNDQPQLDPTLTRYIPIMFTNVEFKVTAAGTVYDCEAVPYNEVAVRDHESRTLTDVTIIGKDVKTLLQGEQGLQAAIRSQYLQSLEDASLSDTDEFEVVFPSDFTSTSDDGNEISRAVLFKDYNDAGTVPFPDYNKVFNQGKKIIELNRVNITPEKNLHFPQRIKVQDIIQEVIIRSDYITNQIVDGAIKADGRGFVNWFRIETFVQDLEDSAQYNRQTRKYIYRVLPYKIHMSNFLPPNRKPNGLKNLRDSVSRSYKYLYTGENTDIIDVNLDFKMSTWVITTPYDVGTRTGTNNANQGGLAAGGRETLPKEPTSTGRAQIASAGPDTKETISSPQAPTAMTPLRVNGGSGNDSEKTAQARFLIDRVANQASLLDLSMTIHGDPYYICSSGLGNQVILPVNENLLDDGSMNYQDSEVDVLVEFRTPIDLDPVSGLYKFEKLIDLYSGLYRVQQIESRFVKNNFTQVLTLNKRRGEYGGAPPTTPIAEPVGATVWSPGSARPGESGA